MLEWTLKRLNWSPCRSLQQSKTLPNVLYHAVVTILSSCDLVVSRELALYCHMAQERSAFGQSLVTSKLTHETESGCLPISSLVRMNILLVLNCTWVLGMIFQRRYACEDALN